MALHYEIYSSSVTCGGLVCLSLKTGIVGGDTSTRVIQYGGGPTLIGPLPPLMEDCPPHQKKPKSPPISQNCLGISHDFPSSYIVFLKNETDFSYILPNKGQNRALFTSIVLMGVFVLIGLCTYSTTQIALCTFHYAHCAINIVLCTLCYAYCTLH